MMFECADCGHEGDVGDITNLDEQCPYCGNYIIYVSKMNKDDFVEELSKMSETNIAKYAQAIQLIAEDIVVNGL